MMIITTIIISDETNCFLHKSDLVELYKNLSNSIVNSVIDSIALKFLLILFNSDTYWKLLCIEITIE